MDEKSWRTLNGWMQKTRDAISAYDKADDEYVRIRDLPRRPKRRRRDSPGSSVYTTKMTDADYNQYDVQVTLQSELMIAARKAVAATCDSYVSCLRQTFKNYLQTYKDRASSMEQTMAMNLITNDISRFDEKRLVMFRDAEDHFEHALARHKLRIDRESKSDNRGTQNTLEDSAAVMDAVENMKMTIRVDWWMFLEEMDRILVRDRDNDESNANDNDEKDEGNQGDSNDEGSSKDDDKDNVTYYLDKLCDFEDESYSDENDNGENDWGGPNETLPVYTQHKCETTNIEKWNFRVETAELGSMYNWFRAHNGTISSTTIQPTVFPSRKSSSQI